MDPIASKITVEPSDETADHLINDASSSVSTAKAEASLKAKLSRKRTKTGCLTCRKRRIKCGEEHPVCRNCIKSKRHCEGYSQRVIFRPPTFDYRPAPNGGAHITFQAGAVPAPTIPFNNAFYQAPEAGVYSQLRPRPADYATQQYQDSSQQPAFLQPMPEHYPLQTVREPLAPIDESATTVFSEPVQHEQYAHAPYQTQPPYTQLEPPMPHSTNRPQDGQLYMQQENVHTFSQAPPNATTHHRSAYEHSHQSYEDVTITHPVQTSTIQSNAKPTVHQEVAKQNPSRWEVPTYMPGPESAPSLNYPTDSWDGAYEFAAACRPGLRDPTPEYYHQQAQLPPHYSPTQMLTEAAVEQLDDDYYDVESDEEMETDAFMVAARTQNHQRAFQNLLMSDFFDTQNMRIRRYDTFILDGMLDSYRAEWHANPLKNPATARVFAHFISATGPSLNIYERQPASSSMLFTNGPVPISQRSLWTYTMPMAALHHQGLLHAMLALSSLQISRLQGASSTPSYQHYAWALKRVHSCVSSKDPKKRLQVTTIAASMLLGFYEIITADHSKWNTHLAGTKQLLIETDFVTMTSQLRKIKREKVLNEQMYGSTEPFNANLQSGQFEMLHQLDDVDERIVSHFAGSEVRFDDTGYVETSDSKIPQELDISRFETLKDLYWWFLKQDAIQSIVSGNALLLDYSRWTQCSPRAPLARPDAVYGTFDHLILILGRIANFAAKDRGRKLKQMELNGGQWRPTPSMDVSRPPQPPQNTAQAARPDDPARLEVPRGPPAPQAAPEFFGMAPMPKAKVQMPSSYMPNQGTQVPRRDQAPDSFDLEAATQAALEEYGRIRAALQTFARALSGEAFQPLGTDYQPSLETPFGPALLYRSYDIGCLWAVYNMCVIIAIRSHPHMHPASHAAAAIAAKETATYANEIGRIAGGIVPGPAHEPLNPTLGSALCESCLPSFFAAVQYQRAEQRHWTVMRIYGIALRTGWGSAELMAHGCETSWVKAGQAGRGPPYERCKKPQRSDDVRLNGHWERLDSGITPEPIQENDRRLIPVDANARLQWAVGVMGVESDYEKK